MALSSELRKLLKKRSSIKASVDSIKKFICAFNPSTQSIRQVSTRLTKLNDLMDTFYSVQESILALNEDSEQEQADEEERLQLEDTFYTLKADMEDLVAKQSNDESTHSAPSSQLSVGDSIRLPTIQLPKFDGKLEDWSSFIDTFDALFHNNHTLNDVQRLHYLKSSVTGSAADIIKNFSITADNYSVAYNELIRQYENKALTTQSHIRSLLETPKATHASASELRKLHHHVASHVRALKAMGRPVQHWDDWLVTLTCGQLDATTAGEWQLLQDNKEMPTYEKLESFLSKRVAALEAGLISNKPVYEKNNRSRNNVNNKSLFIKTSNIAYNKCPLCPDSHKIYMCKQFNQMSVKDRQDAVSKFSLCFNCLNAGHQVKVCRYPSCPQCGKKHNSKLHKESNPQQVTNSMNGSDQTTLYTINMSSPKNEETLTVLLSTSIVHICDSDGHVQKCRAVLDSGSQLNFITTNCIKKLGLPPCPSSLKIKGVSSMSSSSHRMVQATVSSCFNSSEFKVTLYSLPEIVQSIPSQPIVYPVSIPEHIKEQLADPLFHQPGPIDILLGAEIFYDLLGSDKCVISDHVMLRQTSFGWIVTGKVPVVENNTLALMSVVHEDINVNSIGPDSAFSLLNSTNQNRGNSESIEEETVEQYFQQTTTRLANGQFMVRLPLKRHPPCLGNTNIMAKKRFLNLEKKLVGNAALAKDYDECLMEYLTLGHMVPNKSEEECQNVCYLPHHAVIKNTSVTTKTRVVFDASAVGTAGLSLNEILMKGPTVQPTLSATLLRFRLYQVALTADIEKMYRQVLVHPEDCKLQRIVYRSTPTDSLKEFTLQTVTFGTKTAPYLATRCLVQLGKMCDDPEISTIIQRDFYVDDLLTGTDTEEQCYHIFCKLTEVLGRAHFMLRKWCSNAPSLFPHLPMNTDVNYVLRLPEGELVGTLGMLWQPITDNFQFIMKPWNPPQRMTKRTLLSDINRVYDPIGLVAPLLVKGKIFVQQLWSLKIDWDDVLSTDFKCRWTKFYSSLQRLSELSVPRRTLFSNTSIQIHGFCDASQIAFGACLYLRSVTQDGNVHVHLFTSKSRVAPLKATTIPRLELCGALLLAELVTEIQSELQLVNIVIPASEVYLWSDSKIVLAWIQSKCVFQVYVSNRIARIQDLTSPDQWNHVSTAENPADLISRGVDVETLISAEIWWKGPQWLRQDQTYWPSTPSLPAELPEVRKIKLVLSATEKEIFWLLQKCSSWTKLIRTTALVQRFVHNCRAKLKKHDRYTDFISLKEITKARCFWLAQAQDESMSKEVSELRSGNIVHRSSPLKSLNPFIDDQGLIRVGGRLASAPICYNAKHPIVLPSKSLVTKLIFEYEHVRLMHSGPQALLAHISLTYWPMRGKQIATQTVRKCVTCFRSRPQFSSPVMAPLPKVRVTMARPFASSGVDLCGPVFVRSALRKVTPIKSYICVFVCMVTRAIHLELISSLSTEDFLAALSRFMARRGQCAHLYSDNGTNFIGADRVLKSYFKAAAKQKHVHDFLTARDITWHFIPPAAPHFGGLWESAVKAAKRHLLCISKGILLTFDETRTLLCKVEAALNSRPLSPLSSDPADFNVLTPSHFLIGSPLMLPPEPDVSAAPQNRLKRYQLMQKQMQVFWKRWSGEYLPQLQRRGKWTKVNRNFVVGDLAILRDDSMPPLKWPLVRVTAIHPGVDGFVRAVTVRNAMGSEFRRPAIKLALLPTEKDEAED